jgi:hypothetical protein
VGEEYRSLSSSYILSRDMKYYTLIILIVENCWALRECDFTFLNFDGRSNSRLI